MRLVLCDDNRILCEALAAVLESHGHRVVAIATCAADGIAAVSAYRPDACLLDLRCILEADDDRLLAAVREALGATT